MTAMSSAIRPYWGGDQDEEGASPVHCGGESSASAQPPQPDSDENQGGHSEDRFEDAGDVVDLVDMLT